MHIQEENPDAIDVMITQNTKSEVIVQQCDEPLDRKDFSNLPSLNESSFANNTSSNINQDTSVKVELVESTPPGANFQSCD